MPRELVQHIKKQSDRNQVWIDCHGENPADIEALGPIEYFPKSRGFPEYYFPYLNQVSECGRARPTWESTLLERGELLM